MAVNNVNVLQHLHIAFTPSKSQSKILTPFKGVTDIKRIILAKIGLAGCGMGLKIKAGCGIFTLFYPKSLHYNSDSLIKQGSLYITIWEIRYCLGKKVGRRQKKTDGPSQIIGFLHDEHAAKQV